MELPKNVTEVSYTTENGRVRKFRVRLQYKGKKFDELFNTIEEAKAYLLEVKSEHGRAALTAEEKEEEKRLAEERQPKLKWFFEVYFSNKYPENKSHESVLKRKLFRTYESFKNTILETEIEFYPQRFTDIKVKRLITEHKIGVIRKKLGEFKLHEITYKTINGYINERKRLGKSRNTILKEISVLNCFYKEIKHLETIADDDYLARIGNPTKEINKNLLDRKEFEPRKKLVKRIDDDNFEKLKNCIYNEDINFSYALLLQYYGAFRMSEAIYLTWGNINFQTKEIFLPQTKTNPRRVLMTKDLQDLLETIEPDAQKRVGLVLKHQTYYKYQKQFLRFRKVYKFDLTTHSLRKDAIGRMIDKVGQENTIKLADILGFTNVTNFETAYVETEKSPEVETIEGVMRNIGHTEKSKNITKNVYYESKIK